MNTRDNILPSFPVFRSSILRTLSLQAAATRWRAQYRAVCRAYLNYSILAHTSWQGQVTRTWLHERSKPLKISSTSVSCSLTIRPHPCSCSSLCRLTNRSHPREPVASPPAPFPAFRSPTAFGQPSLDDTCQVECSASAASAQTG